MDDTPPVLPPSNNNVPSVNHQLSLLPDLEADPNLLKNPYLWLLVIFIVGSILVISVCGYFKLDGVASTWIVSGSTLFTVACGALGANGVAKKGIYISAASRSGIFTKDVVDGQTFQQGQPSDQNGGQQPQ